MMQGRMVALTRPTDDEYDLIAAWLQPSAPAAALAGQSADFVTADAVRQADRDGKPWYLIIRTLTDDQRIGMVSYRGSQGGHYMLGGAIGDPELWRRGYAADAFMVLVDFLFHTCNAHKVQSTVMAYNEGSIRLHSRGGFVCEGVLRKHAYLDGQWHDAVLWAMLREEFYARAARDLAFSEQLKVRDMVPAEEKARARQALLTHLRSASHSSSIGGLLADLAEESDAGES